MDTLNRCIRLQKGTAPINGCNIADRALFIQQSSSQSFSQQKRNASCSSKEPPNLDTIYNMQGMLHLRWPNVRFVYSNLPLGGNSRIRIGHLANEDSRIRIGHLTNEDGNVQGIF